jgi:hypothetical protein
MIISGEQCRLKSAASRPGQELGPRDVSDRRGIVRRSDVTQAPGLSANLLEIIAAIILALEVMAAIPLLIGICHLLLAPVA